MILYLIPARNLQSTGGIDFRLHFVLFSRTALTLIHQTITFAYWTFGGRVGYMALNKLYMTLGYGTDESIKDYESETWNIVFFWNF